MNKESNPEFSKVQILDQRLRKFNLRRVEVPIDGNCFFHALVEQIELKCPSKRVEHRELRRKCAEHLRYTDTIGSKRGENWRAFLEDEEQDDYLNRIVKTGEWADHLMIQASSNVLNCKITIISTAGEASDSVITIHPKRLTSNVELVIGHVAEKHYFSTNVDVMNKEFVLPEGTGVHSTEEAKRTAIGARVPRNVQPLPLKSAMKTGKKTNRKSFHPTFENPNLMENPKYEVQKSVKGDVTDEEDASTTEREFQETSGNFSLRRSTSRDSEIMYCNGASKSKDVEAELEQLFEPPKMREEPEWDKFRTEPRKDEGNDTGESYNFLIHIAKYVTVLAFGGVVFFGGVVSMGSLLVLTNAFSLETYPFSDTFCGYGYQNAKFNGIYERYTIMIVLMLCLCFPEALSFCYSLYRIIMKYESDMVWDACFLGMIPEILHAVGLTLLVMGVLPYIDATISVALLSLVAIVPSWINFYAKLTSLRAWRDSGFTNKDKARKRLDLAYSITAMILQPVGICLLCWQIWWTLNNATVTPRNGVTAVELCIYASISLLFISLRYWENFVTKNIQVTERFSLNLLTIHEQLDRTRFKTGAIYAIVRSAVIAGSCFFVFFIVDGYTNVLYEERSTSILFRDYTVTRASCSLFMQHFWNTGVTHCLSGLAVFFFGRVACQTKVQRQAYAFPLTLVSPVMIFLAATNSVFNATPDDIMRYFFNNKAGGFTNYIGWSSFYDGEDWIILTTIFGGLFVGWFTVILMSGYLWRSRDVRLARTEMIFVKPIYGGILITQDLMLNRRQYQKKFESRHQIKENERKMKLSEQETKTKSRRLTVNVNRKLVPQLFLCATMWHESTLEMLQLLTSIMRLDKDQCSRRANSRKDDDFYNFQAHIMFDDAMTMTPDGPITNKWVYAMIVELAVAANKVEPGIGDEMYPPVIYPTPYGGRLEFILPWGNMLHVHLKDKSKIRLRKRWSQCMYMYYILGYLQQTKRKFRKEDVFLLALDGDVDFQPRAVHVLLDRMKRNPDVGAACGRIHPVGNGPLVWFQKFEYAIGHWLQKTAEHVLGCVLCSPGCLSLFRGVALMDVNVINKYTKPATEARHYIQRDQGEDRWLCTLLLKQGWKIEYAAASDCFTFAPEEFKEFYNQRRRWVPSTMANIFDLLQNAKFIVNKNNYISRAYITYQMGLMASSILGPATVVLVVQGAFQYVFGMSAIGSLLLASIPVVIFVILCFTTKPDFQIAVAGVLTIIYTLIMMAVLVGIVGQMTQSLQNPNSIFMLTIMSMYAFAGIIHPTEMMCLVHGIFYFLCVPSAFILLMVYSLCNMDIVTWGTRELSASLQKVDEMGQKQIEELKDITEGKTKKKSMTGFHASADDGYACGCGEFCKTYCCFKTQPVAPTHPQSPYLRQRPPTYDKYLSRSKTKHSSGEGIRRYSQVKAEFMGEQEDDPEDFRKSLIHRPSVFELRQMDARDGNVRDVATVKRKMRQRKKALKKQKGGNAHVPKVGEVMKEAEHKKITGVSDSDSDEESDEPVDEEREKEEENEGIYWILSGPIANGQVEYLDDREHEFWRNIIDKYLLPIPLEVGEKTMIATSLKRFKNKMTGAYFLINALWIVLTFSMTLVISDINITFYDNNGNAVVLQPLAFLFLIFFLVILAIQFVTMLVHRWSTFVHLMSTTSFSFSDDRNGKKDKMEYNAEDGRTSRIDIISDSIDIVSPEVSDSEYSAYVGTNFSYKDSPKNSGIAGPIRWKVAPNIMNQLEQSTLHEGMIQKEPAGLFDHDAQNFLEGSVNDDIELASTPVTVQPRPEIPDVNVTVL